MFFALIALVVAVFATSVTASPVSNSKLVARNTDFGPTVELCTGNIGTGCVTINVATDTCLNFTGGFTFLIDEVSSAVISPGIICTFAGAFACDTVKGGGVVLQSGTWNMENVPGIAGNVNFNDKAKSFTCSPV